MSTLVFTAPDVQPLLCEIESTRRGKRTVKRERLPGWSVTRAASAAAFLAGGNSEDHVKVRRLRWKFGRHRRALEAEWRQRRAARTASLVIAAVEDRRRVAYLLDLHGRLACELDQLLGPAGLVFAAAMLPRLLNVLAAEWLELKKSPAPTAPAPGRITVKIDGDIVAPSAVLRWARSVLAEAGK